MSTSAATERDYGTSDHPLTRDEAQAQPRVAALPESMSWVPGFEAET